MARPVCGLLLVVAACGTNNDDRPLTVEYVTEAVLAPTCGAAPCHSTFKQSRGDVFDTVEAVRRSLVDNGLIAFESRSYDPDAPENSGLITWVTKTDPFNRGIGRMPYDAPMPNEDIKYLEKWIRAQAPGAQCDPALNAAMACNKNDVVQCNPDWTFGDFVLTCSAGCASGVCQ
jgi:hypothetical protein